MSKVACVISSYAFIVTNNNYGALFQYFALAKYLKTKGISSYWLRYKVEDLNIKKMVKYLLSVKSLSMFIDYLKCNKSFMLFIDKYMSVSNNEYYSIEELSNNVPDADIYITGSDQVWAGSLEANYLRFAPKGKKRVAFSASFGKDALENKHLSKIEPWLQDFDFVSVREQSGVDICKSVNVEATHLIDPTLLICKEDYPNLPAQRIEEDKYIYCYFTNIKESISEVYWDILKDYADEIGCKLIVTPIQGCEHFFDKEMCVYPSPEDWLRYYRDAEYVFTNTFHGSVFAIIFNKQFLSVLQGGESSKQNTRLTSILDYLNLNSRIFNSELNIRAQFSESICWDKVAYELKANQLKTDSFIHEVLDTNSQ